MRKPILCSFVRYRPYFETGEFVNVGLFMCEPEQLKLTYRLVSKDHKRVTDFFYGDTLFEKVRETISQELEYIVNQPFNFTAEEMARFFHHYVDVKEGIVQYSNASVGEVDDPQAFFDKIYFQFIDPQGEVNR